MSHRATLASLIALFSACSSMPDSSEAQAAYDTHRATIDDVDRVLRERSRRLLRPFVICEDAEEVARSNDAARNIEFTVPGRGRVVAGDGEHRPGLEVVWTIGAQMSSMRITLAVLTEDETTPSWRAAQRARLVAAGVRLPAAPRANASP